MSWTLSAVEDGTYLSEDYYFCKRCREHGIDIHMDFTVNLTHYGQIGYGRGD